MAKPKKKVKAKPAAKKKAPVAKKAVAKKAAPAKRAAPAKKQKVYAASLTPLDDRLLVEVEGPSEKTAGGIYIPGNASEKPNRGKVIAAGTGRRNKKGQVRPLDVGVGDTILFAEYAGTKVSIEGSELLILREEDVLGIVT